MIGPMPWLDRVVRVLERLPVLEDHRPKIEKEALNIIVAYLSGDLQDQPRKRRVGTKKAARQLTELRDKLHAVDAAIGAMSWEADQVILTELVRNWQFTREIEIFGTTVSLDWAPHPRVLASDVQALIKVVEASLRTLISDPNPTHGTRPKKNAATGVARTAIEVYERLTGENATVITDQRDNRAKGPFLDFIRELFAALDIEASPELRARAVLEDRRGFAKEKARATKVG